MIPALYTYQITKRHMFGISLLLHILLLLWLLGFIQTQRSNPLTPSPSLEKQQDDQDDVWASTRARHSAPVIFSNPPAPTQQQTVPADTQTSTLVATQATDNAAAQQEQEQSADSPQSKDAQQEPAPTVSQDKPQPQYMQQPSTFFMEAARRALYKQMPVITKNQSSTQAHTAVQPPPTTSPLSQQAGYTASRAVGSMPSMAHIAQGFSQYAREEGEHTINVMGDPRKLPTEQQLKQHHYVEKILQCLHTSYATMRHTDPATMQRPQEDAVITLVVHRNGSISDLHITRSSKSSALDDFYVRLFKDASNSFPPLPSYFTYDFYRMNWLLLTK